MDGKTFALLVLLLLPQWARTQDAKQVIGQAEHTLATEFIEAEQWDSAVHYGLQAVALRESALSDQPAVDLGKSNYNLGYALLGREDFVAALPYLRRAITVYENLDSIAPWRLPTARMVLAQTYTGIGDFARAEALLDLVLQRATAEEDDETRFLAHFDRGNLFLSRGDYKKALADFTTADGVYRPHLDTADPTDREYYDYDLTLNQLSLATTLTETGDITRAEAIYRAIIPKLRGWEEYTNLARAHNNLGNDLIKTGRLKEGRNQIAAALKAAEQAGSRRDQAVSFDHLGEYFLRSDQAQKALLHFKQAVAYLLPPDHKTGPYNIPTADALRYAQNKTDIFVYLGDQARALDRLIEQQAEGEWGKHQLALYRTADLLVDYLREQHGAEASKLFWREKVLPVYAAAIRRCHENGDGNTAFYFFEKSKAILLHEALVTNDALSRLPDSLRLREARLRQNLVAASKYPTAIASPKALLDAQRELETFRASLQESYPWYRTLTASPPPLSPTVFRTAQLENEGRTLVHYFVGPQQSYALLLDGAGVRTVTLGPSDSLRKTVDRVLAYFTSAAEIQNDPKSYAAAAHTAYRLLLQPLGIGDQVPLLIIPDGPLAYLPFPALLTESVTDQRFGSWPYLLHRHAINYGHSASIIQHMSAGTVTEAAAITAFAPFTEAGSPTDYPPLNFSSDELSSVSDNFASELQTGNTAHLRSFQNLAPEAEVLHLSTHAFSSPEERAPHLAFYDSLLYLRDIYQLSLQADLVVLSACQTNIGRLAPGEGVLGLGRAFIQAGAGGIVASLWNVNARSTGSIFTNYYDALGAMVPKGQALHAVQKTYLLDPGVKELRKSPYAWAGLTYYGPDVPLPLARRPNYWWWAGGIVLLLVFSLLVWKKMD